MANCICKRKGCPNCSEGIMVNCSCGPTDYWRCVKCGHREAVLPDSLKSDRFTKGSTK